MKSSTLRKTSNFQSKFSPNGQFLVVGYSHCLNIYDCETQEVVNRFTCADSIDAAEWSSDSKYLFSVSYKSSIVQVWSIEEPDWTCKIDEGSLGLSHALWAPDGRHILTIAKFHLRITVWSLVNRSVSYIKYPKNCSHGLSFSPDSKYLAILERRDCKDHVSLFLCSTWNMVDHFEPESKDAVGLMWSPGGDTICIWENFLENYQVFLYSLNGHCLASCNAYQWSLGIKSVQWSPTSQFLAVGGYDQKIRLLNHITWKPTVVLEHPTSILSNKTVVYQEIESNPLETDFSILTDLSTLECKCFYETVTAFPFVVPHNSPDLSKANPKYGVGTTLFSSNARYLASINDNMPRVLWIWDMDVLAATHCLIQKHPIKNISWNKSQSQLALCTANDKVYLWSPEQGATVCDLPDNVHFQILQLEWHPTERSLVLMSKEHSCLLNLSLEN